MRELRSNRVARPAVAPFVALAVGVTVAPPAMAQDPDPYVPPPLVVHDAGKNQYTHASWVANVRWELNYGPLSVDYLPARRMRSAGMGMSILGGLGLGACGLMLGARMASDGGLDRDQGGGQVSGSGVGLAAVGIVSATLLAAGIPLAIGGKRRKVQLWDEAERRVSRRALAFQPTAPGGPALRF